MRQTNDQRQSHGLRVFVEASRCAESSSPLCEPYSHVEVSPEDSFRYYQMNVHATDRAKNTGMSTAYVVVIPQKYKDELEDPNYFVNFIEDAPDASNVIESKTLMWDTSRDDPVTSEFVSITVSKSVTGEMSMSGIHVPDDEEELQELIAFLEAQLLAGLSGRRRLQASDECVCLSSVKITSLSSARRRLDNIGRRLQEGGGAVIQYEIILTCEGNCDEEEEVEEEQEGATDGGSDETPNSGNPNNNDDAGNSDLMDISKGLSSFISNGNFANEMKKAAEETGMTSLAGAAVESVAVSDEIQTSKETNAAIKFVKTISLPVQDLAELDQTQVDQLIEALTKVLESIGCVSHGSDFVI